MKVVINAERAISIRDIESLAEITAVEDLQMEAWGRDERSIVPFTQFVAVKAVGGVLVGAFDGETLVGFAYGFLGHVGGHLVHHSHMLAVKATHRNLNLGFRLKLAQRERVLAAGLTQRVTWTFDPLQSLNAYFNIAKLGVLSDTYKVNVYGEETSSVLHRNGTDRFMVTWLLDSPRVRKRLDESRSNSIVSADLNDAVPLLQVAEDETPHHPAENVNAERLEEINRSISIEIPGDINSIERADRELARQWRAETRRLFLSATAAGFVVREFQRAPQGERRIGIYLLSPGRLSDFAG